MNTYLKNSDNFKKYIIYDFSTGSGGIGDCIKFFLYTVTLCIKHNYKICYKVTGNNIENFLKLKHEFMYIKENEIDTSRCITLKNGNFKITRLYNIVKPHVLYHDFSEKSIENINASEFFYFSQSVVNNVKNIIELPGMKEKYISFHVRLGDKFLETDKSFVYPLNLEDTRIFSEKAFMHEISKYKNENVLLFCDNNKYKHEICEKFENVMITKAVAAHSDLKSTSYQELLDTVTEFYIICNSSVIYAVSKSGFSFVASLFNNSQLIKMYETLCS